MLGGTSSINAMIYIRGNRRDYDHWSELGNNGWEWENVLEYFKKSEDNRVEHVFADEKHHGRNGPLKVDSFNSVQMIKMILAEAVFELGYEEIFDCNGDKNLGFLTAQGTVDYGSRCSTVKAFLIPAMNRSNLHIVKHAHVTELDFHSDGSVKGVKFMVGEKKLTASANKEVILSAGALKTPQVLMLSGIGTQHQLNRHNITVRKELPVGLNLQDHLIVPYAMTFHRTTSEPISITDYADAVYQYSMYQVGRFSNIGSLDFVGFVSTVNDTRYPDIQYHVFHFKKKQPELRILLKTIGYKDEIVESFGRANDQAEIVIWAVTLLKPKSRGKVVLRSSDPFDSPKIYHNYLTETEDLETIVRGINILQNITSTSTFKIHEGEEVKVDLPECAKLIYGSQKYWRCYIRHLSISSYHAVGTAKMGPDNDLRSVVDDRLKVKGVKGLRVVDASIMPEIISGNTNAPTIMIGEKASAYIKEQWS